LHRYAAKKAYRDLIIKNNKSIKNKLLQIYQQCIKESFKRLIYDINTGRKYRKNFKLIPKIEWYTLISIKFLLSLSITFMPKAVLFLVIRVCANTRFFYLNKINKVEKGSKKSHLFDNRRVNSIDDLRISENRIAKTNRPIERSLRTVVMDNRKQMKHAITDEEKGLQILAQGQ
jgi:hypothetical protein